MLQVSGAWCDRAQDLIACRLDKTIRKKTESDLWSCVWFHRSIRILRFFHEVPLSWCWCYAGYLKGQLTIEVFVMATPMQHPSILTNQRHLRSIKRS